ncbi:hypothetical protein CVT25_012954 [Psilocybe cyanescens]|uniref:Uncharacterized protein n=1 Tax=Psilocybe cyanescens TaxID=93625 RepID=A0A409XFP8_PSICY|nr:hypothetical protein CVT25_012954 [Psilocybe cyanescens]
MLLKLVSQHNVMDMTSQGLLIELCDNASKGEGFSEEELNSDGAEEYTPIQELVHAPSPSTHLTPPFLFLHLIAHGRTIVLRVRVCRNQRPRCGHHTFQNDVHLAAYHERPAPPAFPTSWLDRLTVQSTKQNHQHEHEHKHPRTRDRRPPLRGSFRHIPELVEMTLVTVAAALGSGLTRTVLSDSNSKPQLEIAHAAMGFAMRVATMQNRNIVSVTFSLAVYSSWATQRFSL